MKVEKYRGYIIELNEHYHPKYPHTKFVYYHPKDEGEMSMASDIGECKDNIDEMIYEMIDRFKKIIEKMKYTKRY